MARLHIDALNKSYGDAKVLIDINLGSRTASSSCWSARPVAASPRSCA